MVRVQLLQEPHHTVDQHGLDPSNGEGYEVSLKAAGQNGESGLNKPRSNIASKTKRIPQLTYTMVTHDLSILSGVTPDNRTNKAPTILMEDLLAADSDNETWMRSSFLKPDAKQSPNDHKQD